MEGHTIEEAAILLKQSADFLRNKILFTGQAHPILKPCVFLPEPRSLRIINSDGKINEYGVDYVKKTVPVPCSDGRTRGCSYDSANIQGLFELTFFPDDFDMSEAKESGRIQLYSPKAVFAGRLAEFSIDMAVGWIMSGWKDFDGIRNQWYAMTTSEASSTKSRIRSKIGQFIILSQNGIHYLVDSPASISLSDICITDKMVTEYAASMGIPLQTDFPEGSVADEGQVHTLEERIAEPMETPEKFALRLRDRGVRKEIIAYELKQTFEDNLQWHEIARLADPDKKYTEMQEKSGNPRKTGQRWANTGKKLKEMTSS